MAVRYLTLHHAALQLGYSDVWTAQLFDRGVLMGIRDSSGRRLITPGSVARLLERVQKRNARRAQPHAEPETSMAALVAAGTEATR